LCGSDDKNQWAILKLTPDEQESLIAEYASRLKDNRLRQRLDSDFNLRLPCPSASSVFYVPGGLGSGVDISDELKAKIIATQGQTVGRKNVPVEQVLPSKYYHVYGSAYIACELFRRGHSLNDVSHYQSFFARLYRAVRLRYSADQIRYFEKSAPDVVDALELLKQISPTAKINFPLISAHTSMNIKNPGWDPTRFEKAKTRLETWVVDFEWSDSQHRVGTHFAARYCL
jgi:hypothetical protein